MDENTVNRQGEGATLRERVEVCPRCGKDVVTVGVGRTRKYHVGCARVSPVPLDPQQAADERAEYQRGYYLKRKQDPAFMQRRRAYSRARYRAKCGLTVKEAPDGNA